jgi:hypothetical protein
MTFARPTPARTAATFLVALFGAGCGSSSDHGASDAATGAIEDAMSPADDAALGPTTDATRSEASTPGDASTPSPSDGGAPDGTSDAAVRCADGGPDPKTAPPTVDVTCFTPTLDDEFLTYDVSSGPVDDGKHPGELWFNGTEQCCLSPSDGKGSANYPTAGPNGPVNPYSLLDGGGLQIRLQDIGSTWFSGVMTSVDKNGKGFSQEYGYFEFDAKLPPGTGTWPGLWMLSMPPGGPGGEIDILEQYGLNPPQDPAAEHTFQMTIHDWTNAQKGVQFTTKGLPDLTAAFHRVGLLWSATYLALYFDGALLWSTPTLEVMKRPYYLLADMGLGSGWDTTQTPSPSDLQIKSIRAYSVPGF